MEVELSKSIRVAMKKEKYSDVVNLLINYKCYDILYFLWHKKEKPKTLSRRYDFMEMLDRDSWFILASKLHSSQRSLEFGAYSLLLLGILFLAVSITALIPITTGSLCIGGLISSISCGIIIFSIDFILSNIERKKKFKNYYKYK